MEEVFEAKALTRNSMMDKLKSKIQSKKIAVEAVNEGEWELDQEEGAPFSIERALVNASKNESKPKKDILDSYLDKNPLFAVAELDGGLIGGTLANVMEEIGKSGAKSVDFKIVTTDENAALAFFEENEETPAEEDRANAQVTSDANTDSKLLTLLTTIKNHAENAESEISAGMFIAKEYDKFLVENGIEDLGLAVPGNKLHEMAEEIKTFAQASKDSAEIILGIV